MVKQQKNNKKSFSVARKGLLTLLASLGVVSAVGMTRDVVNNDGPDNPKDKKENVVELEHANEMNLPTTIEELQAFVKMADSVLENLDARLASGELNAEDRFYARNARKKVVAERAEALRRLLVLQQEKSNIGR